jgi:hypothetical protein
MHLCPNRHNYTMMMMMLMMIDAKPSDETDSPCTATCCTEHVEVQQTATGQAMRSTPAGWARIRPSV